MMVSNFNVYSLGFFSGLVHALFFSNVSAFVPLSTRIPCPSTSSTTLIQYADDHTPTPFSRPTKSSPYDKLMDEARESAYKKDTEPAEEEITLYEVLGVSPAASRDEMKQHYNALARRYHPDAIRSRPKLMFVGTPPPQEEEPDFGEISAAWKVLSDEKARKKYDRELQYKKWADHASEIAMKTMEDAAPVMAKMFDDIAVPLIEKTAVSTVSMAKAAYRNVERQKVVKRKTPAPSKSDEPVISMDDVVSKIQLQRPKKTKAAKVKSKTTKPHVPTSKPPIESFKPFFTNEVQVAQKNEESLNTNALQYSLWTFLKTIFFF